MKKILTAAVALTLTFAIGMLGVGCKKNTVAEKPFSGKMEIFTMPSTQKVVQSDDTSAYYGNGKGISVALAKNEYESMQLMLRPDANVSGFNLEAAELKTSDGKVLPKSAITVYAQWYVNLYKNSSGTNGSRRLGYYPDALIPMDAYRAKGYDKIDANNNQGITVEVKTETDTAAGEYFGNFTLTYAGKTEVIPVSVTVWNFAVPTENHVKSALGQPYQEELIYGQLDNTPEMLKIYYDYLLDRRICTNNLALEQVSDAQKMAMLREYSVDERVTAYSYTMVYENNGGLPEAERRIRLLIENSDEQHNLLKKEFIYAADEPYGKESATSAYVKKLVDMLIKLADEYEAAGMLEDYGLTWEDIASVEILVPYTCQPVEIEGLRTYCPSLRVFASATERARYDSRRENAYTGANNELAADNYATTWWYTATGPVDPRPNQHIDNELYSLRAMGWMQHEYKIEGYLNWGAFVYADTETVSKNIKSSGDTYYDPTDVIKATNGDGYILYPGAKFGIDGPLPSLRQLALTDAFEDYEYLYLFNRLAEQYVSAYGAPALEELLMPLYRSVYTDIIAYSDFDAVLNARKILASYIELLSTDMHGLVYVGDVNLKNKTVEVDVYASSGTTLTVDGKIYSGVASGSGVKITVQCDLSASNYFKGTLKNGSESLEINTFLSGYIKSVSSVDSAEEIAKFSVSRKSDDPPNQSHIVLSLDSTPGKNTMKVVFGACLNAGSYEKANYRPAVLISKENFLGSDKISDISTISVKIYNPSGSETDVIFQLRSGTSSYRLDQVTLMPGWNSVTVSNVNNTSWAHVDSVTEFAMAIPINLEVDVTLYFGDLYYTYTG